ncbi:hypothetical protein RRG08_013340 [Elysia crispata]|uniref:Uncharacterized protein n=1 Tax=Elysia crispata TaxID=231223 RepID=A0AAE1E755_9GAST|nr:hypothetical protein RRG08_013340 [Elysia crispata]
MCDTASQQPILNYSVCLLRTRSASSVKVASNACINVRRENQLCSSCSRTIPNVHESQSETFGLRFLRSGRRPGVRELLAHLSLACLSSRRSHAWNCTGHCRCVEPAVTSQLSESPPVEGCQSARNEKLNIYSPQQNLGYLLSVYLGHVTLLVPPADWPGPRQAHTSREQFD